MLMNNTFSNDVIMNHVSKKKRNAQIECFALVKVHELENILFNKT